MPREGDFPNRAMDVARTGDKSPEKEAGELESTAGGSSD